MFYWIALFFVIGSIFYAKRDSLFYLKVSLYIFCGGAVLRIIGLNEISEIFMRISFIFATIGFVLAIRELK